MFKQGKKFENNQKKYNKLVDNLNLISITQLNIVDNLKSRNFSNILEGLEGADSVEINPIDSKNLAEMAILTELEGKFNQNMSSYITLYKTYLEELASRQSSVNSKVKSKVISYGGEYYYVNNVGTARKFTQDSWKEKDNSCPESSATISPQEFSKLAMNAPPMASGEQCRSGGYNAKNKSNSTTAWVDNLGFKHTYSDFINRNSTCPSATVTVTGIQYNAIPSGSSYGKEDKCQVMSLDSPTHDKLAALNQKLLTNVTDMKNEINKLATDDVDLDNNIKLQKNTLKISYNELLKQQEKIKKMKGDIAQYRAGVQEQNLSIPAIQMHHLIWVIIGGAFVATAIYNSK